LLSTQSKPFLGAELIMTTIAIGLQDRCPVAIRYHVASARCAAAQAARQVGATPE
jgi:hypothetical protein